MSNPTTGPSASKADTAAPTAILNVAPVAPLTWDDPVRPSSHDFPHDSPQDSLDDGSWDNTTDPSLPLADPFSAPTPGTTSPWSFHGHLLQVPAAPIPMFICLRHPIITACVAIHQALKDSSNDAQLRSSSLAFLFDRPMILDGRQPGEHDAGISTWMFHGCTFKVPDAPHAMFDFFRGLLNLACLRMENGEATREDLALIYAEPVILGAEGPPTASHARKTRKEPVRFLDTAGKEVLYLGNFHSPQDVYPSIIDNLDVVLGKYLEGLISFNGHFAETVVGGERCVGCEEEDRVCNRLLGKRDEYLRGESCGACLLLGTDCYSYVGKH